MWVVNSGWLNFITALMIVESGDNASAIGDNGKAIGCLQIHESVVKDVNRHFGVDIKHKAMADKKLSIAVCSAYLRMWGRHYQQITGKEPTYEILARIWNGGPNGWQKDSTEKYWCKVEKEMNNEK